MRPFDHAEKLLLHELLEQYKDHPKKWCVISKKMSPVDISQQRSPDSIRNHVLRWNNGKKATAAGTSKKRCSRCGEIKAGHICKTFSAPQGISKAKDIVQAHIVDLPPLDSALAGRALAATGLVPGSPYTQGDDDWLAGPPGLELPETDFMMDLAVPDLGFNLPALELPPQPLLPA